MSDKRRSPVAKHQRINKGGRHRDKKKDYRRKPKHSKGRKALFSALKG